MGQQASQPLVPPAQSDRVRLLALPPRYTPLYDALKGGDASGGAAGAEELKDALARLLDFGPALRNLPNESEVSGRLPSRSPEKRMKELVSDVDSVDELFSYVSYLAAMPALDARTADGVQGATAVATASGRREDGEAVPGMFDARVAAYVKHLQALYQLTKKAKYRHEQRLQAVRAQATSLRRAAPPPLPLPTQNCLSMGWGLVAHLLRATRSDNPEQYALALQMVASDLQPLKPTAYADGMYLAPSASAAFDLLGDCLGDLATPTGAGDSDATLGARTIETLAELGLARGSLATMLFVVRWLMQQPPASEVSVETSLAKLAALKEQPMYGRCEAWGELYSCGQNSYGELGTGDDVERHQLTSVALCGWDDIRQVVSGNETLAILTNDGVVLTCGLNKSGQCGQGHFDERVMLLRPVQALRAQRIKFVAASNGCEHMIALTEAGLAYSWGYNDRGQLGHENLTTKIHLPKLVETLKDKKLVFAAVSYHHSAAVTDGGELYTFGMNDCGQLGLDHTQHQSTPQLVKSLEGQEVAMVACGLYHTILCTTVGELFVCGKNDYGQLGLGHNHQVKVPTPVALPNESVCFVACGYYHSVIVTASGKTFSFGRNDYGQLGIGTKIHQNVPSVVALSANTRMMRATCGCYHTVLLSEQGQVFVFGRNNKGQLGNRGSADALLPVPLKVRPEKNARRCIDVAAGFYTTSLIVERKRENDEGDAVVPDQSGVVGICGRVDIDRSGEVEGLSNFGSISTVGVSLFHGSWFYEVEVVSSGLIQVGWIDGYFQGSSDQGEGVGDHAHSWSYDGNRQRRWNSGSSSYGEKWKAGDIIGCLLDLDASEMTFFRNGINLGIAYSELKCSDADKRSGMMPGISLERGEIIRVNLGHQPFAYPPTVGHDFASISRAVASPASSALIQSPAEESSGSPSSRPPALEGSASVLVGSKLFVIGGMVVDGDSSPTASAEPSTHVWVHDLDEKRWERWTDFPIPIRHHQVVAIDDNQILVLGGENNCTTSRHMDLYKCFTVKNADGSLPMWTLVHAAIGAATSMPQSRAFHTASSIRVRLDTMVFMYGGKSADNEVLGDAWYLSLDDYAWSRLPSSLSLDPGARTGCSSAVIGESVYVFGGQDREEKFRSDLWLYNTFDRVWHLCHDDNISTPRESTPADKNTANGESRGDFDPALPEARVKYSMCADLGNIWIFGGADRAGTYLRDMWCYSVASQKWNRVDTSAQEQLDGCCSAELFVRTGAVTALASLQERDPSNVQDGDAYLFGGRVCINGEMSSSSQIRKVCAMDSARSYNLDMTKNVSTTGKSAHVLSLLRGKCGAGAGKLAQQCSAQAMDSAICLLSHLDRLAGNDIPGEDSDSIQLSRCTYRSLCIDPKEKTFSALHQLLENISARFFESAGYDDPTNDSIPLAIQVLYPLLVTIRLLKLNFFELSRSCLELSEIGLRSDATQPGGILYSIRELLFKIADHVAKPPLAGEALWFYHAVKQETASAIFYGFPTLFPSILNRLQVMNRLMANKPADKSEANPMQKLLIPMLVPRFTSVKMLFQLMSDSGALFESAETTESTTKTVTTFTSTLLNSLWAQATVIVEQSADTSDSTSIVNNLEALETTHEFKCLNVMLRAAIFWCSCSSENGWRIVEAVCAKLVGFMSELLDTCLSLPTDRSQILPILVQRSFPGKLLPFILLSVFSLPAVRDALPVLLEGFWPQLEALSSKLHSVLTLIRQCDLQASSVAGAQAPTIRRASKDRDCHCDFDASAMASVSKELLGCLLQHTSGSSITYGRVLKSLWDKITHSKGFTSCKVKELVPGAEIRRLTIPLDLAKLLGTETLLVQFRGHEQLSGAAEYDSSTISFLPSRTILSQHIYPAAEGLAPVLPACGSTISPPPAPVHSSVARKHFAPAARLPDTALEESRVWLQDFQKVLVWVGSHYAATLIIGEEPDSGSCIDHRWLRSPLFRGGLETEAASTAFSDENDKGRNAVLLQQIIDNTGDGKKLLDKVRNALDPGSTRGSANPQLRVARLRRQDSVEVALEKSGGFEAVDRAVRITFAALLKHTNISYTTEPISKEGELADTVIDAWRAALQLRRWIVREQQKLAASSSETGVPSICPPEMDAKERQKVLYNAICEPVARRAGLLLELAPAPIITEPSASSPMKLLPGISMAAAYATHTHKSTASEESTVTNEEPGEERFVRQLNALMETKSMEAMEEEDERVQADTFAFIQQPVRTKVTPNLAESDETRSPEDHMRNVLLAHQIRAKNRLYGLKTFIRLLECTESIPSARFHIVPTLSSAFKRVQLKPEMDLERSSTNRDLIVKVHYLINLEFAGPQLAQGIGREFFDLLTILLKSSTEHLRQVQQIIESSTVSEEPKAASTIVQQAVHDMLLVMETCCFPFRGDDWDRLHSINLASLLTELTSWKGWQSSIKYDASDDSSVDVDSSNRYPILPASIGTKFPNIICSRYITLGTDLRKLTITHKSLEMADEYAPTTEVTRGGGGLAVFDKMLNRGRWYWEVSVRSLGETPVFVGVTPGTADLNNYEQDEEQCFGVFLHREGCEADRLGASSMRWNRSDTLGVLLDCEEKQIVFFNRSKRCYIAALASTETLGCGYFPAVGVQDADVHWNLMAPVPAKLWCASSDFQFPMAVISGGLVASPFNGATISWDGRRKGNHLQLLSNGTTVVAGDTTTVDEHYKTVMASQGFQNESIFVEIRIIAPGKDGRCALGFGIVGSDFTEFDTSLNHKLDVTCRNADESLNWSLFGVLFDFEKATVTLYSDRTEPELCEFDVSTLTKPLFPAVSTLCNGAVFDVNFHPRARLDLPPHTFYPAAQNTNSHSSSSNEMQLGKCLQLQVYSCDGGEFSSSHTARNCLLDDTSVYSSAKGANVNMVLKHEVDTPMCVSYINVRGPGPGYSSPLRHAAVFVTSTPPDVDSYKAFDNMTAEEFAALPFPPSNGRCPRDESLPVAFFVLDGSCAQISKQLAFPVTGRYILVKAICPSSGTNIDLGYIGFCGIFDRDNGPAYNESAVGSYSCEECKVMPLYGVYYGQRDDDTVKLCAACYDDNRGDLDSAYYVYASADSHEDQMESNTLLCPPRRVWRDKMAGLVDTSKRTKSSGAGLNGGGGAVSAMGLHGRSERLPSIVTYEDCELFSCGQNNYGELCLGHCNSTSKLEHVPFFSTKGIRDISGGNEVLAVVMKDGSVFTCGLNKSGQCGNGTFEERVIIATPVRALSGIAINMVAAANGCEHMLAVAADGAVYSWGYNDRGQLGLGSTISKSHTPRMIDSVREKYHITTAALSYHHSAVVSSNGELLTFGMNDCGQLGLDHVQHQHTPQLVDALASQVVTKVACGLYHTIAVTAGGEVYSFGKNDYGQLGLGHARNAKVPTLVKASIGESDEKIVTVSCGYYHTVAVTEKGKLVTWGRNDYGQLGIGSKDHKNCAQYVPLPLSSKIKTASCGCYHTLILLSNGRVMVFGRNNKGQLGAGSRTLPSADLPLPVPSNSLANDEVVRVAAGFYSSYILTGRSTDNRGGVGGTDDASQAKDLPENSCLANSDALFESLMKEIDRKNVSGETMVKRAPLQVKRSNLQKKLPLVKLHAAGWAMTRALIYQSLRDAENSDKKRQGSANGRVNPVLTKFISFLLENLELLQLDPATSGDAGAMMTAMSAHQLGTCGALKSVCVGLLQYFGANASASLTSPTAGAMTSATPDVIYAHFYRNQILWVLLSCGSVNNDVGAIIAANSEVSALIITGMNSPDLATATVCIRLAMLVFPLHSVSSLNKIHRTLQPTSPFSGDIVSALMTLVGLPLVLRPRLCSHELGLECSSMALCKSARCLKGVCVAKDSGVAQMQQLVLEKSHVAEAKAAEAVALLRYLTMYPTWKVAVNAALARGFAKAEKISELLDTICTYYTNVQQSDSSSIVPSVGVLDVGDSVGDSITLRKPETTSSSPEIEESINNAQDGNGPGSDSRRDDADAHTTARDKHSLMLWQKAKDALDGLATILAAVCIVGGHVEGFREGGTVVIEGDEVSGNAKAGVLVGIKKDTRTADLVAQVMVHSSADGPITPFVEPNARVLALPVSKLQVVERIPAVIDMFDSLDSVVVTLATMSSPSPPTDEANALHCDLDQPQNNSVQEILRGRLKMYKQQVRWRATKALSSLLKQMAGLSPTLASVDSQLVSSLAALLASESSLSLETKSELVALQSATILQKRWLCVKQRQAFLETEEVIDVTMDHFEAGMRDEVVRKLGSENALSWGMDAIQSPRRKVSHPIMPNSTAASFGTGGLQRAGARRSGRNAEGELPFGAWGVLHPLPPLNESEGGQGSNTAARAAIDYTPFVCTAAIVRVGRAADSCDLIVNDRSVSGRHFHLRRVHRETEGSEEQFELQDFSKNGTIVNGVRVHGSSTRITSGSRISLILSRGGLVTYEFQVRSPGAAGSVNRNAPSPIATTSQNPGDLNIMIPGQEYQQPQVGTPLLSVPRSPAELQNRGSRRPSGSDNRVEVTRSSRIAASQGLHLITSVAESDVPRALISPNPAVDSPRVGGFNSPRSSVLQTPGTPAVGSPTASMYPSMVPPGILSPASFQQRESVASSEVLPSTPTTRAQESSIGQTLRIALGRDSVNRESSQHPSGNSDELTKTRVLRANGETSELTAALRSNVSQGLQDLQQLAKRLLTRVQDARLVASSGECEEALRLTDGNADEAFHVLQHNLSLDADSSAQREDFPANVRHLALVLGKREAVCAEALRQTENDFGDALRLILSSRGAELENVMDASAGSSRRVPTMQDRSLLGGNTLLSGANAQPGDGMVNFQDIAEENPSYALAESSAVPPPAQHRSMTRPIGSPIKARQPEKTAACPTDVALTKSELTMWSECNSSFDESVRKMNAYEAELEEEALCQGLTAIHARKILLHIVRLFDGNAQEGEAPLGELGGQLVLRQLISVLDAPTRGALDDNACESEYQLQSQSSGKVQQILKRTAQEALQLSPTQTLVGNLRSAHNLSMLERCIDHTAEQPSKAGWTGVTRLVEAIIESEGKDQDVGEEANDLSQPNMLENVMFDTVLHILSRTYAAPAATLSWESSPLRSRKGDGCYPKGPLLLSCGLEAMVVDSYERVWSVPPPDPVLKFRHKWRKRFSQQGGCDNSGWMKSAADHAVTIWRPTLPSTLKTAAAKSSKKWFSLGDVVKCGNGVPDAPLLLVIDHGDGLLMPPMSFERVDVTGTGLPKNSESDLDFQRKQLRSIWWPVAPPGYVALGCVAGSKETPFSPPALDSTRCVREDLVKRADAFHCVWRATSPASTGGGGVELPQCVEAVGGEAGVQGDSVENDNAAEQVSQTPAEGSSARNQAADSTRMQRMVPMVDDVVVRTSLWTVDVAFGGGLLLPVITLNDVDAGELSAAFTLSLSDEDRVLCAPVGVDNVLSFVEVLLQCHRLVNSKQKPQQQQDDDPLTPTNLLCAELPSALFALAQQVIAENLPSSGQAAVALVRALITVVQCGAPWHDKHALLYCRSKIMALSQDQDGGFTLHALLQAFVELMLVVEDQQRGERVRELAAFMEQETPSGLLSLPYRFHFAKQPYMEMLVSHSSKMVVTRHLSGEERKFLLDYRAEDGVTEAQAQAMAAEGLSVPPGEIYSCRFEHTPALVMTMQDKVKAEIVYFEVTVMDWSTNAGMGGALGLGFSPPSFPLEGALVGDATDDTRSYAFVPSTGKVISAGDTGIDRWRWVEPPGSVSPGDVLGCGLRLDTQEMFVCKNGQLLGTAFSSLSRPEQLHPTISFNADCKLLANLGSTAATTAKTTNFSFRFHSLDCDNLMSAFDWYEPLSQVYGVMKALMDPARPENWDGDDACAAAGDVALPDEFMLSADNFLSEISEDVCTRVESVHPYDLELQEALVSIPLATSIRVRLDQQSETASSHCLQILQGGGSSNGENGADGAAGTGGEAEVRAFTGACGGQEATIDGDSFVWRFPVQSNFQCRVDRARKGPYLKLEARDTRLSLARDKGWQTAIGVARFDGGVHIWEVRIAFVTASSNIFLGVARRDVRLDSYLGKDNRGWGWIGNRALWHNGSKQRGTYGDKFKTGDVVRLTLDLRRGTLSYALNGKDLGVAFGPGGTGPKLEGTFYPGFALYNQRDSIDLIGGHRVEDGGDGTLPRTGSGFASGEDSYYSEEDEEVLGLGVVTTIGDATDGTIPNFRMELAIALSQMGFPMEWCIYALRQCEDDPEQAADFILANMHAMEVLVREEAEALARRARRRQILNEQAQSHAMALADHLNGDAPPPPPPLSDDDAIRAAETTNEDALNLPPHPQVPGDKWGVAFTAVPEFSLTGRRLLAAKYKDKLVKLHASQRTFTAARDRALVQLVNELCEARAEALLTCDPLRMTPEELAPSEEQLQTFPELRGVPLEALRRRFLVLRNFNCRLQTSLAFIDLSVRDERSLLARGARELRGLIFQHVKLAWWLGVLKEQQAPPAARPEIEIDRHRARDALELAEDGASGSVAEAAGEHDSVFAQAFEQLHPLQPALLRGADRAFKCQFVGEFGDDFGGLYRECLAQLSSELQTQTHTPLLPLLRPCPNALNAVGENRELFVPNAQLRGSSRHVQMAEFLGKLAGVAVRTRTPLDLNLPPAVWKLLVGQRVSRQDVESIHQGCFQVVDTIANLQRHGITEHMFDEIVDASFTVLSSSRETVELVPGGRNVQVTWEDREAYARAVETYRLTEFAPVCGDLTRGLATILPRPTLGLFTWRELRTMVCGKPSVDVALLRRRTIYGDGCQGSDPHIAFFWDVLGAFTDEQKSAFLRFVWGRSRLPTLAADFTQDFKISGLPKASGRADMYLPIAHTCFFSIDLPAYSSREIMHNKLVYAITHCQSIDADNTTVAQRAGQGLNWTAAANTATTTATAAVSSVIAGLAALTGE